MKDFDILRKSPYSVQIRENTDTVFTWTRKSNTENNKLLLFSKSAETFKKYSDSVTLCLFSRFHGITLTKIPPLHFQTSPFLLFVWNHFEWSLNAEQRYAILYIIQRRLNGDPHMLLKTRQMTLAVKNVPRNGVSEDSGKLSDDRTKWI